jgi:hypothetical protein
MIKDDKRSARSYRFLMFSNLVHDTAKNSRRRFENRYSSVSFIGNPEWVQKKNRELEEDPTIKMFRMDRKIQKKVCLQ